MSPFQFNQRKRDVPMTFVFDHFCFQVFFFSIRWPKPPLLREATIDQLEVDSMVAFFWLQHSADRAIRICTQVGWPGNSRKCGICGGSCRGTFQLLCFIAFLSRWRLFWHIRYRNSEEWKPSCHVTGFNHGDIPRGGFNCMTTCGICFALRNWLFANTSWHFDI